MSTLLTQLWKNPTSISVFVILGLGFLAMFAGTSWFWMIWVLGFAVLIPLLSLVFGEEKDSNEWGWNRSEEEDNSEVTETTEDPLVELQNRSARNELTDKQFERKLDRLLEAETYETGENQEPNHLREYE